MAQQQLLLVSKSLPGSLSHSKFCFEFLGLLLRTPSVGGA